LHGALSLAAIVILTTPVVLIGLWAGAKTLDLNLSLTSPGWALIFLLPSVIGMTGATWVARRFLDRRSFRSLGLEVDRTLWADLAIGFAIPMVMMGAIFAAEFGFGWIHIESFALSTVAGGAVVSLTLAALVQFLLAAYQEELLSRGYHLQNLSDAFGKVWGVVVSSLIFGLLHLANPSAGWASTLGIFVAGAFLAYAYLRTRRLWLSIGLHAGWNFFEGTVFGFQVSGLDFFRLIRISVSGPELWTGGAFGPEAGLIILPAIVLGTVLVWVYTRRRSPPPS
jgi:membrane protease YdiL (CAAX protease family)